LSVPKKPQTGAASRARDHHAAENTNHLAPLNPGKIKSIAVIGPNADRELLGGYSGRPKFYTSLLEGIRSKVGDRVQVPYCEGCKITVGGSWNQDLVKPSHPEEDRKLIQEAVKGAQQADVIVVAIGGNEQTSREAWSRKHMGDRTNLDLVGRQQELVTAMLSTGKPVIVFLFNGSPLSIQYLNENVPVIFECWYLGQETGHAVADVLFGDFNPGGKLPITIPRSAGHLPRFTITNRPRAAATCSTMFRRSILSVSASATPPSPSKIRVWRRIKSSG